MEETSNHNLYKYRNAKPEPIFLNQCIATFKRRMLTFLQQPKELMMGVNPVLFILVQLISFNVIIKAILVNFKLPAKIVFMI